MPDTYTTGKLGLIEPARGGYVDTWDEPLYANWQTLEAAISGTTTLTLTNANVVLTVPTFPTNNDPPTVSTSCQNLRLYLTGTLAANLTVFIPATVGGFWIIDDITTGNFTVTIKTTAVGSTGIVSIKNKTLIVFSDGTNVKLADSGNTVDDSFLVPSGMISPYGGTSAPIGWLICNGAAVSRTTYATLFARIGVTWGAGDGSTTFNVPDLANMFLRGSGTSNVGVYEADTFKTHTHGVTDPGHSHTTTIPTASVQTPQLNNIVLGGANPVPLTTSTATTGVTIQNTGDSETRPVNKRVLYIIKT